MGLFFIKKIQFSNTFILVLFVANNFTGILFTSIFHAFRFKHLRNVNVFHLKCICNFMYYCLLKWKCS